MFVLPVGAKLRETWTILSPERELCRVIAPTFLRHCAGGVNVCEKMLNVCLHCIISGVATIEIEGARIECFQKVLVEAGCCESSDTNLRTVQREAALVVSGN